MAILLLKVPHHEDFVKRKAVTEEAKKAAVIRRPIGRNI